MRKTRLTTELKFQHCWLVNPNLFHWEERVSSYKMTSKKDIYERFCRMFSRFPHDETSINFYFIRGREKIEFLGQILYLNDVPFLTADTRTMNGTQFTEMFVNRDLLNSDTNKRWYLFVRKQLADQDIVFKEVSQAKMYVGYYQNNPHLFTGNFSEILDRIRQIVQLSITSRLPG